MGAALEDQLTSRAVRAPHAASLQSYFLQRVAKQRGLPFIRLSDEAGGLGGWQCSAATAAPSLRNRRRAAGRPGVCRWCRRRCHVHRGPHCLPAPSLLLGSVPCASAVSHETSAGSSWTLNVID